MPAQPFNPELIQGTVTELKTLEGKHNFVMSGREQTAAGAAAAGAATVGSLFASSILANAAIGLNEHAVFFTCKVNNIRLSGCFNTVNITEGEEVELVINRGHYKTEAIVYAIRKPEQRCLWVAPMMEKGHAMTLRLALVFPLIILMYFSPAIFIFFVVLTIFMEGFSFLFDFIGFLIFGVFVLGGGFLYRNGLRHLCQLYIQRQISYQADCGFRL